MPEIPLEVIGNDTDAQGRSAVVILFLSEVCMPRQRTLRRPTLRGSCLSSTTPINHLKFEIPRNAILFYRYVAVFNHYTIRHLTLFLLFLRKLPLPRLSIHILGG